MNNRAITATALNATLALAEKLNEMGFKTPDPPFASGNVEGAWIVEGEHDNGVTINVEVVCGPLNDEDTWETSWETEDA